MATPIPLSLPDITQREIDAVVDVLQMPALSSGPQLEEFERHCARIAGRRFAAGVSSGTAGLHCALLAAGIGAGDEVLTTPFSFVASANCILYVGAKPKFVDIDPKTLNMDPTGLAAALTPRTKAIVAVEAFGHPGGMLEVERFAWQHKLMLIEDCCEGFGGKIGERPIGSFGNASVFGFCPNKQVTTGEGGMIVTDDEAFADLCRSLRNQGRDSLNWLSHQRLGYNYRLSGVSAALGVAQCERIEQILDDRRRVAHEYMTRLMDNRFLVLPTLQDDIHMSWFMFVVRLCDLFDPQARDQIMRGLRAEGIGCGNYFPPIHLQPYMAEQFQHHAGDFPVCEYVATRTIALPFFARMSRYQVHRVCDTLEKVLDRVLTGGSDRL